MRVLVSDSVAEEGLEAFGDVGVAFLFVACVEFFGGVFPVHYEFSSAHR